MILLKNNYYEEDEKLFSTGDSDLDDLLEEVYYSGLEDGYDYFQKEFALTPAQINRYRKLYGKNLSLEQLEQIGKRRGKLALDTKKAKRAAERGTRIVTKKNSLEVTLPSEVRVGGSTSRVRPTEIASYGAKGQEGSYEVVARGGKNIFGLGFKNDPHGLLSGVKTQTVDKRRALRAQLTRDAAYPAIENSLSRGKKDLQQSVLNRLGNK